LHPGRRGGPGLLACPSEGLVRLVVGTVLGAPGRGFAGCGSGRPGGEAGEGSCGAVCFLGGSPAVSRRWFSSCLAFQARRMRWLRATGRVAVNSVRGARPMRRHQPRTISLAAGSLMMAKPRSAPLAAGVGAPPGRRRVVAGLIRPGRITTCQGSAPVVSALIFQLGYIRDWRCRSRAPRLYRCATSSDIGGRL
jgi:hypothetical protein